VRSAQIQIVQAPQLGARARAQQVEVTESQSPRGTIFDRNGAVLAVSTQAYILRINTGVISETNSAALAATTIAPVMKKPVDEIQRRIQALITDSKMPTPTLPNILYTNLTPQAVFQLTTTVAINHLNGIVVEPSWVRVYPLGMVAGPTLGFVNLQPHGFSGVEGFYDTELTSEDSIRKEVGKTTILTITRGQAGANIILTLDAPLQSYVEKRLAQGIRDYRANGGTIIVMDTRTGAILASASSPGYDPNNAMNTVNSADPNRLHDPAASDLYEPGSVFKLLTTATGIEEGVITTRTMYNDSGKFVVDGRTIRNSDRAAHGHVTILGMLQHSLNVVAAQVAMDIGPEKFYRRLALFGIGRKSGIDLQNETAGLMRTPADASWSKIDMAENSFGQSLAVTPYQVINAINVIANDGVLMQPYIVQQWRTQDGQVINKRPTPIQRVISPETARQVRLVTAESTRTATPKALVKGYTVAGKTGTATWYLRGVPQNTTIVTYVGWVPAYEPRITILVKFDQPMTDQFAATTALPVFHDVAERAVQILGVPPDIVKGGN
jgi:cell division protein FtsI/penicillin-binding protein 2